MQPGPQRGFPGEGFYGAHVGLGGNLEAESHILKAIPEIASRMKVLATSRFYRTPPFHPLPVPQPPYVNGVLHVEVSVGPWDFKFRVLREIETKAGRVRTADVFAPRVLDLDLLLFDETRIRSEELTLPDPDIYVRSFWTIPLAELLPDLPVPGTSLRLHELAARMESEQIVYLESLTRRIRHLLGLSHPA